MKVQHGLRTATAIALAILFALFFLPTMAAAERPVDAGSQGVAHGAGSAGAEHRADRATANFTDAIADAVATVDTGGGQSCDGTTGSPGGNVDDDGEYGNNCDFGPSPNGNGDGAAVGKPCAGCVGNADDMNPGGPLPGPKNDNNAGYECDPQGGEDGGNAGVGVGNPAHTGCAEDEPGDPVYVYECRRPSPVDDDSAALHAFTNDPTVQPGDVEFHLDPTGGEPAPVEVTGVTAAGQVFSQVWTGLTPLTEYVFSVDFGNGHTATDASCDPFRTRSQQPPPPPPPPAPPPEPNAPVGVPTEIEGAEIVNRRPPEVLGVQFNSPGVAPAAFARTGSEPGPLVTAALMMIFFGTLLATVMRRQHAWVERK